MRVAAYRYLFRSVGKNRVSNQYFGEQTRSQRQCQRGRLCTDAFERWGMDHHNHHIVWVLPILQVEHVEVSKDKVRSE